MPINADLLALYRKDPHCHWCKRKTRLVYATDGILPLDAATKDHVYSRLDPKRKHAEKKNGGKHVMVLACRSCNAERAAKEHARLLKGHTKLQVYVQKLHGRQNRRATQVKILKSMRRKGLVS